MSLPGTWDSEETSVNCRWAAELSKQGSEQAAKKDFILHNLTCMWQFLADRPAGLAHTRNDLLFLMDQN